MSSINIRNKGATGEREIANALNDILYEVLNELGMPLPVAPIIQRNQNQTAVGGKDLSNTFDLAIEVKRQEQLSVNTWWAQCVRQAERNNEKPILIYRQNRMSWRVVMMVGIPMPGANGSGTAIMNVRGEILWENFLTWFRTYAKRKLMYEDPKV